MSILPRTAFPYVVTAPPDSAVLEAIVSLTEIKSWLELDVDDTSEDTKLAIMRDNVLFVAQEMSTRVFVTTEFTTYRDSFNINDWAIELRKSPLNSLVSFEYLNDDVWTAVPAASYYLEVSNEYSRVLRKRDYAWPDADDRSQAIRLVFTAGYDSAAALKAAWPDLKAALLSHIAAVYTNRGDCDVSCDSCRDKAPATAQKTYNRMRILNIGAIGGGPEARYLREV